MGDLEQILLSRLPCAPIIYDLIIKMKTRRAASRRVSRWAPCGTKNSIEKPMLIYENYELSLPDSQPKSGKESRRGGECNVVGGEVGGRGGSHLSRLHLEIPLRFLSLFAFRFIFFHNSYIFFLGLFSLLYRSFLSGLPFPSAVSPPFPRELHSPHC